VTAYRARGAAIAATVTRTVVAAALAAALLTGCTAHSAAPAGPSSPVPTTTTVETITKPPPTANQRPIDTGPTKASSAPDCPLGGEQAVANKIGMRLARIQVLSTGGTVRGCRIYALQHSPLATTEHLPGPHQPAVEVTSARYVDADAAHNAVARLADRGRNPQRVHITPGVVGACFQTTFYPRDHGRDWACAFAKGTIAVLVRTVVVSPALDAIAVARLVAGHF
jgi:hypothetical protein